MNNNKVTFQLWENSISLCSDFVKSTNLNTIYKNDSNLTELMEDIIIKEVAKIKLYYGKLLESLVYDKPMITDNTTICLLKVYIHNVLLLFSSLYESNVKNKMYDRLGSIFNPMSTMTAHVLMLRCLHMIKIKLTVDDRIVCDRGYTDYYPKLIECSHYQQIIDHCVKSFYETYSLNKISFIGSERFKVYGPYVAHTSKEINTYIEETKNNKLFVTKLLTYETLGFLSKQTILNMVYLHIYDSYNLNDNILFVKLLLYNNQ